MATQRMSSDARRAQILDSALKVFSSGGYDSVSVGTVAALAGVSQPYIFRLFGTKKDLYVACIEKRTSEIREAFAAAASSQPDDPLTAMAAAYLNLLADDPDALSCQLQAWSTSGVPEIRDAVRTSYLDIWRDVHRLSGASGDELRDFMAQGMLLTVVAALDLAELYTDPDAPLRALSQE
jgi:AcrR family transcriptional regulator